MEQIEQWVVQWQAGHEGAAEQLYNQFRVQTYRLAYGLLGNTHDAEEVMQDALQYALANIQKYDVQQAKFSTWLHTITISRARNRLRRKWLPSISLDWLLAQDKDVDAKQKGLEDKLIHGELWQMVQGLKPTWREVILLRFWLAYSYPEMADILNCPVGTAQSRTRRALAALRKQLQGASTIRLQEKSL